MTQQTGSEPIYQGQFGEFTITDDDRTSVIVYRSGLAIAALTFALGSIIVLNFNSTDLRLITALFTCFSLALGVSLWTIHIYLAALHRLLQLFWGIGTFSAILFAVSTDEPLALTIYNHPTTLFGIGFIFAALTGIYFKEAFCFDRLETKILTFLVPVLLLGHLTQVLPVQWERLMLATWAALFVVFAIRKALQPIPPDIGDKSVFAYLKQSAQT